MSVPGPNSWLFLIVLAAGFVGLLVWLARAGHLAMKIVAGTLAFAVSTLFGAGLVNNFYQYYTSWGALYDDLSNAGAVAYTAPPVTRAEQRPALAAARPTQAPASPPASAQAQASPSGPATLSIPRLDLPAGPDRGTGRLVRMQLPGPVSGISRSGYVYLPPQYLQPAYATDRFPVLELLHGDPGDPSNWVYGLDLAAVMDAEIQAGRIGPMVVVMPATFSGAHGNDCVDGAGARNDTYLSRDVPADVAAAFRVLPPGPNWGIGGLSDGGFCGANLALRHRGSYGAVVSMDGFYSASADLRVLHRAVGGDPLALTANDPTVQLATGGPLPQFWIMAGTGNGSDLASAVAFRSAVQAHEPIRYVVVRGGDHSPPAWRAVLPDLLRWAWTALSGQPAPIGVEELRLSGRASQQSSTPAPPATPGPATSALPQPAPPPSASATTSPTPPTSTRSSTPSP